MLYKRVAAAIFMVGVIFGGLYLDRVVLKSDLSITILLAILVGLALFEFYGMAEKKGLKPAKATGIIAGMTLVFLTYAQLNWGNPELRWYSEFSPSWLGLQYVVLAALVFLAFFAESWRRDLALGIENISVTVFGVIYIWFLSSYLLALRHLGGTQGSLYLNAGNWVEVGQYCLLTCVIVSKSGDIGAYTFGRIFGRVKLAPGISPGKTIEGAFGGLVLSAGVSLGLSFSAWGIIPPIKAVVFGVVVGVAAQMGDLAESMLKRSCGVKDSGHVIPGFGGVLDVLDALLVSAPVAYYMLLFMSPRVVAL